MNKDTEKPKLYLETSISSYLTARQSRDVIQLARQQITVEWWNNRLNDFDIFISQIVIDEASSGDLDAARKRMEAIQTFPLLEITDEITELAEKILSKGVIPEKGARDASHIAISIGCGSFGTISNACNNKELAIFIDKLLSVVFRITCRGTDMSPFFGNPKSRFFSEPIIFLHPA